MSTITDKKLEEEFCYTLQEFLNNRELAEKYLDMKKSSEELEEELFKKLDDYVGNLSSVYNTKGDNLVLGTIGKMVLSCIPLIIAGKMSTGITAYLFYLLTIPAVLLNFQEFKKIANKNNKDYNQKLFEFVIKKNENVIEENEWNIEILEAKTMGLNCRMDEEYDHLLSLINDLNAPQLRLTLKGK